MVSNFWILILTHLVSDLFLQPGKWAVLKATQFRPRLYHCIQYTIPFLIIFYFININFLWGIWIFASHLYLDSYALINWWDSNITGSKRLPKWFLVMQDQVLHILTLIPVSVWGM